MEGGAVMCGPTLADALRVPLCDLCSDRFQKVSTLSAPVRALSSGFRGLSGQSAVSRVVAAATGARRDSALPARVQLCERWGHSSVGVRAARGAQVREGFDANATSTMALCPSSRSPASPQPRIPAALHPRWP